MHFSAYPEGRQRTRRLGLPSLLVMATVAATLLPLGQAVPADVPEIPQSIGDYGGIGLLELPTARVAPSGTVSLGGSSIHPYDHLHLGFQPLSRLEMVLRASLDRGPREHGDTPLPAGVDAKLVLWREDALLPQIAFGLRGLGSDRFAAPYLVLSRRLYDLDLTLGAGWGRLAGLGRISVPLPVIGDRFAPFGGVQVQTPLPGLSLLAELSPDPFTRERTRDPHLDLPIPFSFGLAWRPVPWLDAGLALERGDRVMARAALTFDPGDLPLRRALPPLPPPPILPRGAALPTALAALRTALAEAGVPAAAVGFTGARADLWLDTDPESAPGTAVVPQIGRAARVLSAAAPAGIEQLRITVRERGLPTATVGLLRADLERAGRHAGSPAELWRTAELAPPPDRPPPTLRRLPLPLFDLRIEPRLAISLADRERPVLYRAALLAEMEARPWDGPVFGVGLRLNAADNLVPPDPAGRWLLPVRSAAATFAQTSRVRLERAHVTWLSSPWTAIFTRTGIGYFEEGYAGIDSEILWRPFTARFAIGAEVAQLFPRDPQSQYRLFPLPLTTGHLDLHYQPAFAPLETRLSLGRYLAGDRGVTAEAARRFDNGVRIAVYATATEVTTEPSGQIGAGLRIDVPLQAVPGLPPRSTAVIEVTPLLRDAGQRLEAPLRLSTTSTTPGSYGTITGGWDTLLD